MEIIKRHVAVNHGGKRTRTDGVVLHTSASAKLTSLFALFSNPKMQASSTWHVAFDGEIEELVDPDNIAWANGAGNWRLLSIETQGTGYEPWTEAQLESIAHLVATASRRYNFPLRAMQSSKSTERGVGYHRLGVPRSRWGLGKWLIMGGERWSSAVGKICPGDPRIAQVDDVIARAIRLVETWSGEPAKPNKPKPAPKPKPVAPKVTVLSMGSRGPKVLKLQKGLNKVFPAYRNRSKVNPGRMLALDSSYGPHLAEWVGIFQKAAGLEPDKVCGPMTQSALKKYGVKL